MRQLRPALSRERTAEPSASASPGSRSGVTATGGSRASAALRRTARSRLTRCRTWRPTRAPPSEAANQPGNRRMSRAAPGVRGRCRRRRRDRRAERSRADAPMSLPLVEPPIGIGGRDPEIGLRQNDPCGRRVGQRKEPVAALDAEGRRRRQEKRHVGAERRGDAVQASGLDRRTPQPDSTRSAAAASLLPPPSPACIGIRLSIVTRTPRGGTRRPAARQTRAAARQTRFRAVERAGRIVWTAISNAPRSVRKIKRSCRATDCRTVRRSW